jgi:hypothetical protein
MLLYALLFVALILTHGVTCYAGYSQGLSRGRIRGLLEEKRDHVRFLKELDERWDTIFEASDTDTAPKNYKDLN